MREHTIFSDLHSCFQPLGTGMDAGEPGCLPPELWLAENTIGRGGVTAPRRQNTVYVREDGPDAWGEKVTVPAGGWYSRSGGSFWKHVESDTYLWLEYGGSVLDVIYVKQDGTPVWETTTAEAC